MNTSRIHATYRREFATKRTTFICADTSLEGRADTGRRIRNLRARTVYSEFTLHEALSEAAASTRLRNAARAALKGQA